MSNTTYVNYTTPAVNAEWLNEINDHVWHDTPVTGTTIHSATKIAVTPFDDIVATDVQAALNEINDKITPSDPIDASEVSYTPAGTGAVSTTVQSKLRERVSVKDFGAVADGVTNAATALVNALATGKRVLVPSDVTSIAVTTTDSPSILPSLDMIDAEGDLTLNLAAGVHTTTSGNIAEIGDNQRVTLLGATPISTTLVSVASVSGSTGNYTVGLNLTDATGIVAGDFLKLDNVVPLMPLSGDNSVFRKRVAPNELLTYSANLGDFLCADGGGTASWSSVLLGVLSDYISPGDLLTQKGQTRVVNTVGGTSVSIIGSWTVGTTGSRAYSLSRPNAGTVSTGGAPNATVTGTGTTFTTEANIGDLLLADGKMSVITGIPGATTLTVDPPITLAALTKYSIITPGVSHEGTHEVLSVVGNLVTVRNRWRGAYPPPVNRISGGEAKAIRTVLKNTGTGDGFSFAQNAALKWANNLVLQGDNTTLGSHGLALDGRSSEGPTQIGPVSIFNGGDGLAVVEWGLGAFLGNGCVMQTRRSHYSGNLSFGVFALEGSTANLREVVVSGTNGRGLQINGNASLLFTEGHSVGNASDGLSSEAGASIYAEIPVFWQNGGMGMRFTGATGIHVNEGVSGENGASGVYASGGAVGEMSRVLFVGNNRENMEILEGSSIVANEVFLTGCRGSAGTGRGVFCNESQIIMNGFAAINNAGGPGYVYGATSLIDAVRSNIQGTQNNGLAAFNAARLVLSNSDIGKLEVGTGAFMLIDGVSPTPTLVGVNRLNEISSQGSLVKNDSSTDGFGMALMRIAGGQVVDKLLRVIQVVNFGTVGAGASVTQTVTVTGATTDDQAFVGVSNSASMAPDGILFDCNVTSANTVSVRARNVTGAGIATNISLSVLVIGFL